MMIAEMKINGNFPTLKILFVLFKLVETLVKYVKHFAKPAPTTCKGYQFELISRIAISRSLFISI